MRASREKKWGKAQASSDANVLADGLHSKCMTGEATHHRRWADSCLLIGRALTRMAASRYSRHVAMLIGRLLVLRNTTNPIQTSPGAFSAADAPKPSFSKLARSIHVTSVNAPGFRPLDLSTSERFLRVLNI